MSNAHRRVLLLAIVVRVSCACLSEPAGAVEAGWRIGLASVCITPEEPVWLHGYASEARFRPFEGVLDDIYSKAMAIESEEGGYETLGLVSAHIGWFSEEAEDVLLAAIREMSRQVAEVTLACGGN